MKNILSFFTSANATGVAARSFLSLALALIAFLGVIGWLSPEQAEALSKLVNDLAGQAPALVAALAAFGLAVLEAYRIIAKSFSDRGAAVAKALDKDVPASQPLVAIEAVTPAGQRNITLNVDP